VRIIENLAGSNTNARKIAIYELRNKLQSKVFAREFVKSDGVRHIVSIVLEGSGTTLAYGLRALDASMTCGFGYESISQVCLVDRLLIVC
jgi:hypothetical protein